MGHPDWQVLKPCPCQEPRLRAHRLVYANLPQRPPVRTFDTFEERHGVENAFRSAKEFCEPDSPGRLLTLTGGRGTGKSHLLEAIARNYLDQGRAVRYEVAGEMLKRLRATFSPDSQEQYQTLWDSYATVELLLLDELGIEHNTPWAMDELSLLIGKRERDGVRLVVATNLTQAQMSRAVDERVADRLWNLNSPGSNLVTLTAASYRTGERW